jgi:hypothetical protein
MELRAAAVLLGQQGNYYAVYTCVYGMPCALPNEMQLAMPLRQLLMEFPAMLAVLSPATAVTTGGVPLGAQLFHTRASKPGHISRVLQLPGPWVPAQ